MRKRLSLALAVAAVVAAAAAAVTAAAPTVVHLGNLILSIDGGVTPTHLPKDKPAPIGFWASGDLKTADGSHPPALKESSFDIDRDVLIDVHGIPTCRRRQLLATTSANAKRSCPGALLGQGKGTVEVAFPEQKPFDASGPLLLFNGGERNGVTTLYVHAYVSIPAPTAIVATAKLVREHKGPYGIHIQTSVPLVAGGSGSVTHFELGASRFFTYQGKRYSFAFARCRDGRLAAQGFVTFRDGTKMSGRIVRTCTPSG
jgi:hypothetical protein